MSTNNYESIKTLLVSGPVRQLIFMVGIALSVALGIVLYMSIQEPTYRPLDYQVTQQNMSSIVDTLDKAGIQYKVNERDGVIYVVAKELQAAKMKLASAGIAKDDSVSYSFLNEQNGFGNSQFVENARYLRALEGDLAKTINAIEGVSGARVHIAVPQNTVFADENGKTTASVMLSVIPGFASDKEKVRSVTQIVAASVPGLDPKDVAITDQYGHFLSAGLDQNSIYSAEQMSYQNNIQNYYEKRIETMITPMLGDNKVTVRVYANIDFTQEEEAHEEYDPDKKVVRKEESSSEQSDSSGASGVPGSLSNSPPGDSDAPKSQGSSAGSGRSQSAKSYEIGKSVVYKKSNFAKIKNLSVAVVVDNDVTTDPKTKQSVVKPVDQDKINKITSLVEASVGFDKDRGDKVIVVNSTFTPPKQDITPIAPVKLWEQPWFWDMVKKIIGIIVGFVFLFMLYRKLSAFAKKIADTPVKYNTSQTSASLAAMYDEPKNDLQAIKEDKINKLKQIAAAEPTRVANIIKNWVGKP